MEEAISREEMKRKLYALRSRTVQWKSGSFKAGYNSAVDFAMSDLESCRTLDIVTVTRCKNCKHATDRYSTMPHCTIHNRSRAPEDYCNHGDPDE